MRNRMLDYRHAELCHTRSICVSKPSSVVVLISNDHPPEKVPHLHHLHASQTRKRSESRLRTSSSTPPDNYCSVPLEHVNESVSRDSYTVLGPEGMHAELTVEARRWWHVACGVGYVRRSRVNLHILMYPTHSRRLASSPLDRVLKPV